MRFVDEAVIAPTRRATPRAPLDREGFDTCLPGRRTSSLKAKRGSPRFDPLVHHACSCDNNTVHEVALTVATAQDAVAGLVGIEGGVVSGMFNLESSGVRASDWRPRHDKRYHEA
jgi:hypothetical protein